MPERKPHPANVPGDFYVEDGCCSMCEVPFQEAPELFGECEDAEGYPHCFVKRQPATPTEVDQMLSAIRWAELRCIRYGGADRLIQLKLVETDSGDVCDHVPPDLQKRADDRETTASALQTNFKQNDFHMRKPWWKFWGRPSQ